MPTAVDTNDWGKRRSIQMNGKIALEEHFNLPQFQVPRYYGNAPR